MYNTLTLVGDGSDIEMVTDEFPLPITDTGTHVG